MIYLIVEVARLVLAAGRELKKDIVAGDELYCLPGGSRIYGEWAANIHDGSTPGGKAITRCITPNPATDMIVSAGEYADVDKEKGGEGANGS